MSAEQPAQGQNAGASYPIWKPAEWTPRQRWMALVGLALLAGACGLLTSALAVWGRQAPLAVDTLIPLGLTALALGATLLTAVCWYAYRHAHNRVGSRAGQASASAGLLLVAALVAVVALGLQGAGMVAGATLGPQGSAWTWPAIGRSAASTAAGVCLLCSFLIGAGLVSHPWRPTRDPAAPGSALGAPVVGWRRRLRWIVAGMGQDSLLLILIPLCLLNWFGFSAPLLLAIAVFGVAAAFFLVALVAELTHRA